MKNISSRSYDSKGLDTRANILTAGIVGRQSAGTCASAVQTFCKCTISLMGYLILSVFYRLVTRYPLNPSPLAPQIRLCWPLCAFINYIYLLTYLYSHSRLLCIANMDVCIIGGARTVCEVGSV